MKNDSKDNMEFSHKAVAKMMLYPVIIFVIAAMFFNVKCNFDPKKAIEGFKNAFPPKESVSRETSVKTIYLIDKKEVSADEYFKWAEKELDKASKNPPVKGKGLKFTGSGHTRSTTKGNISYGNGR